MAQATFISGLDDIIDRYDHFILDIFGVIHDGIHPFPDTIATLKHISDTGKQTCLLSNSPRRADGAASQMEMMGISRDLYDHIVTSGEATYMDLRDNKSEYGQKCWFIGGGSYIDELMRDFDYELESDIESADFILNSIPGTEASDRERFIKKLEIAARRDLPMICANPDLVVNIGRETYECAGTFAKIYEDMGGRVTYHGKPHRPVYDKCYEFLGRPDKSKILAIGDAFHTDVTGANRFGVDCALNLVGIHYDEVLDLNGRDICPQKMQSLLESKDAKPAYYMHGFSF